MNSFLFAMLKLLFFGVRVEEVHRDKFPGKQPPRPAPKIPGRCNGSITTRDNNQIADAYRLFKEKYPTGVPSDQKRVGFSVTRSQNTDEAGDPLL